MRVPAAPRLGRLERQQQQLTDRSVYHEQIFHEQICERLVGSEKRSGGLAGTRSQVLSIVAFGLCVYRLSS